MEAKRRGRAQAFVGLRRHRKSIVLAMLLGVLSFAMVPPAAAAGVGVSAPITESNGLIGCSSCTTATPTQYGVAIGTSNQALGWVSPDSVTTHALFSGGASANPTYRAIAVGDLPVKGTSAANVIGGTAAGTTLDHCAKWDTNGNLVDSGGACGASALATAILADSATTLDTGNVTVYMSLSGSLATTATSLYAQTPIPPNVSFKNLYAVVDQTCTGCTLVLVAGTCGSSLTAKSTTVTPATANTVVSDTSNTTALTSETCAGYKITKTSTGAAMNIRAWIERSA